MASGTVTGSERKRSPKRPARRTAPGKKNVPAGRNGGWSVVFSLMALILGCAAVYVVLEWRANYTVSFQSPIKLQFEWPVVIARRTETPDAYQAQKDQSHPLTAYQQYACQKFGSACRVALAIQRAENPQGKCEVYHYNSDGTLDWGYFQINTVHLQRPGVVLRNLLDCKTNIDFAYTLYTERHGFTAWSTYNSGAYRKFLHQ